jgi:hypothetical protein
VNKILPLSFGFGAAIALLLYSSCVSARGEQQGDPSLLISPDQETLSAKLNGEPLLGVLSEIGDQTGIEINVVEEMKGHPIWADFKGLPLEEGIRRLLRGQSYTITHSQDTASGRHITGINVLEQASSPGGSTPNFPSPKPQTPETEDAIAQKIDNLWQIVDNEPAQAKESLKKAMRDRNLEIRETALEVMANMDQPFISELLGEMALRDSDPQIRLEALNLLADHGQDEILRDTLMKSAEDPDQDVRETAEHLLETLE